MTLSENGRGAAWHVWINGAKHGRGTAWHVCIGLKGIIGRNAYKVLILIAGTKTRLGRARNVQKEDSNKAFLNEIWYKNVQCIHLNNDTVRRLAVVHIAMWLDVTWYGINLLLCDQVSALRKSFELTSYCKDSELNVWSWKFVLIFKNSLSTSQKLHWVCFTKNNLFTLFIEISNWLFCDWQGDT
jgi:hypothetical protein